MLEICVLHITEIMLHFLQNIYKPSKDRVQTTRQRIPVQLPALINTPGINSKVKTAEVDSRVDFPIYSKKCVKYFTENASTEAKDTSNFFLLFLLTDKISSSLRANTFQNEMK